jgi:N-acetylmuramoyl-L-alanine amidase
MKQLRALTALTALIIIVVIFYFLLNDRNVYTSTQNGESSRNHLSVADNVFPMDPDPSYASRLVVIDPGHGGIDPGAEADGLFEKDIVLDICVRLDRLLRESGVTTYLTRNEDNTLKINTRIEEANRQAADLVLSLHCDSFGDSSYHGTSTLYYTDKKPAAAALSSKEYAQIVQDELISRLGTNDRGILQRTDIGILEYTSMPSVLVELGFLSNTGDAALLGSDSFRQQAAEALAEGVKRALTQLGEDE